MAIAANYREGYAKYSRYFKSIAQNYGQKPVVRTSIELLLTFLTISFFAVFAIRPTVNTIAGLIAEIKTQKEIQTKLDEKLVNLKKAQVAYAQGSAGLTFLEQALPKGPQPDQLVRQLEGLAAQDGLVLASLNIDKTPLFGKVVQEESKKTGSQFEVSFLIKGDYQRVLAFLLDVENLRRIINITSVSLGTTNKTGEQATILLTISAEIPYYEATQLK